LLFNIYFKGSVSLNIRSFFRPNDGSALIAEVECPLKVAVESGKHFYTAIQFGNKFPARTAAVYQTHLHAEAGARKPVSQDSSSDRTAR